MASEQEWKQNQVEKFCQDEEKKGEKLFRHKLTKSERIRERKLINSILRSGKKINSDNLTIYYTDSERNQIGILISRKVKGAVIKNKIKRAIREAYRTNKFKIKEPKQIIFLIRKFDKRYNFHYFDDIINQWVLNESF